MGILQPKGDREYVYVVFAGHVSENVLVRENQKSFLVKSNRRKDRNINVIKEGFVYHPLTHPCKKLEDQFMATRNHRTAMLFAMFQCRFTTHQFKFTISRHR